MTKDSCCLCRRRGKSHRCSLRSIAKPSFYESFKIFIGDANLQRFKDSDVVCPKCHIKVRNFARSKGRNGGWTFGSSATRSVGSTSTASTSKQDEMDVEMAEADETTSDFDHEEDSLNEVIASDDNAENMTQRQSNQGTEEQEEWQEEEQAEEQDTHEVEELLERSLYPNIKAVNASQAYCFICKNVKGRHRIPKTAIKQVWDLKRLCIPLKNRSCANHLSNRKFTDESMSLIVAEKSDLNMSTDDFAQWFLNVAGSVQTRKKKIRFDFSKRDEIDDEDYVTLLGITKQNFDNLFGYVKGSLHGSSNRHPKNALAMFLMVLRLNISQNVLAIMFGINNQSTISRTISVVLDALVKHFVPLFLGFDHMCRDRALQEQSRNMFNIIFEAPMDSLFFIMDGTYIYIDKPSNFALQKNTYSGQKKRNLVKPFMIVFPSGYVLDAPGPFLANGKNNDAGILNALLRPESTFTQYVDAQRDHFVVDRGFRDSIKLLNQLKIKTHMPSLLEGGRTRFSTAEANDSRLVTLCRWVVEAVNGRVKIKFKFFADVVPGSYFPKLGSFFRVAMALINAYCPPLLEDTQRNATFATEALARAERGNLLEKEVTTRHLDKRTRRWIKASKNVVLDFPKLNQQEMELLTLGVYQIGLADRYARLHEDESSDIQIQIQQECPDILRAKVESRFTSNKSHNLWIKYDPARAGTDGIIGHFCQCKQGSRTVGCCAHITAVIWYLSFYRHQPNRVPKNKPERKVPFLDAATYLQQNPVSDCGSDESDTGSDQ